MKDHVVVLTIGERLVAVPLEFVVRSVLVHDPVPAPFKYPMLSYVIYEEGLTLPLIDLSVFFGTMPRLSPEGMAAVLVDNGGEDALFALLVDKIRDVREVSVTEVKEASPLFSGEFTDPDHGTIPILSPMKVERLVAAQLEFQGGVP